MIHSPMRTIALLLGLAIFATSCSTKPKEHAWQFWRRPGNVGDDIVIQDPTGAPAPRLADYPDLGELNGTLDAEAFAVSSEDIPLPEPIRSPVEGLLVDLATIYFDYDSDALSPMARTALQENSEWIKDQMWSNPHLEIRVEGHCDDRGTDEYNFALGERRALAVREQLVGMGIDSLRLHTHSWGEMRPAPDGLEANQTAWQRNRRVEFAVWMTEN